ncbi:MAG: FAD-binding oxidoreductase [Burkholderiales bacterium]|nr:FAD-binding oxidoreductase [Burkholderiales bacterium]
MAHRKSPAKLRKSRRVAHFRQLSAQNAPAPNGKASWDGLARLESSITGRIVLPSDPDYDQDRQESNPAFQSYPQIIVYCVNENDIISCIQYAQQTGMWVAVRSGGHSTAGYSVNDGMVIDVSGLNSMFLDSPNALVYAGGGTNWDTFNGFMGNTGWHVPTGACGGVCVAGFVQGGGYGYTSRAYGIQSDCVASFRVILADGTIVYATADNEFSDLFWALRGGTGGNFGIVTQVAYNLVTLPSVWAWAISWSASDAAAVLALMQEQFMVSGCPDQLGYMMNVGFYQGQPVYMVQGMYAGSRQDGLAAIQPLLDFPSAQLLVDQVGSYPAMDSYLENNPYPLPDQPDGTPEGKASCYISETIPQSVWQQVVDYVATSPNAWSLVYTEPYGGAINRYPVADSAFIHRNVYMDFCIDVFWQSPSEQTQMLAWMQGLMDIVAPYANGHVYQNYPMASLQNWQWAYFGDAYPTLQAVKAKYDPGNFFNYQQSIQPASNPGAIAALPRR